MTTEKPGQHVHKNNSSKIKKMTTKQPGRHLQHCARRSTQSTFLQARWCRHPVKKHIISGIKPSYTPYYKLVLLNRALSESPQFTSLDKEIPLRDPFPVQQGPLRLQRQQSSSWGYDTLRPHISRQLWSLCLSKRPGELNDGLHEFGQWHPIITKSQKKLQNDDSLLLSCGLNIPHHIISDVCAVFQKLANCVQSPKLSPLYSDRQY